MQQVNPFTPSAHGLGPFLLRAAEQCLSGAGRGQSQGHRVAHAVAEPSQVSTGVGSSFHVLFPHVSPVSPVSVFPAVLPEQCNLTMAVRICLRLMCLRME